MTVINGFEVLTVCYMAGFPLTMLDYRRVSVRITCVVVTKPFNDDADEVDYHFSRTSIDHKRDSYRRLFWSYKMLFWSHDHFVTNLPERNLFREKTVSFLIGMC